MNKLTPLATSLVDAPPPRTTEGEKRLVKGERGDLRRPEGEGGGGRKERADGGERGRAALGRAALWGIERSRARGVSLFVPSLSHGHIIDLACSSANSDLEK